MGSCTKSSTGRVQNDLDVASQNARGEPARTMNNKLVKVVRIDNQKAD
jgi:hypothetical protein